MKTLRNYIATPFLRDGNAGPEANVRDQVRLYLDTAANPDFPEFIDSIIQHPVVDVNCGSAKSYSLQYDEADLEGSANYIKVDDVIDYEIITQVDNVIDFITPLELNAPPVQGTTVGLFGQIAIATIGGVQYTWRCVDVSPYTWEGATSGLFYNSTISLWRKAVLTGTGGSESLTFTDL